MILVKFERIGSLYGYKELWILIDRGSCKSIPSLLLGVDANAKSRVKLVPGIW